MIERELSALHREGLIDLGLRLIDQKTARVVVAAQRGYSGFWFGGGNMVEDPGGRFYLTGRYRNAGDSRSGLSAGERGMELAIFCSEDRAESFTKVLSFSKQDLSAPGRRVISIEGSALLLNREGVELYVSSEKEGVPYPPGFEKFQKPGTGIWSVDRLKARSFGELAEAPLERILSSNDPRFLHVKDPVLFSRGDGSTALLFCSHPFNWSSSNSGFCFRSSPDQSFGEPNFTFFPRGYTWDVAVSRITDVLPVPRLDALENFSPVILYFYDGAESMRALPENEASVSRPRGFSCEEIGGLAAGLEENFPDAERLSAHHPLFVSPMGTGSSRYVHVLRTREGLYATWQQSQQDYSQPLVLNFLGMQEVSDALRDNS